MAGGHPKEKEAIVNSNNLSEMDLMVIVHDLEKANLELMGLCQTCEEQYCDNPQNEIMYTVLVAQGVARGVSKTISSIASQIAQVENHLTN